MLKDSGLKDVGAKSACVRRQGMVGLHQAKFVRQCPRIKIWTYKLAQKLILNYFQNVFKAILWGKKSI